MALPAGIPRKRNLHESAAESLARGNALAVTAGPGRTETLDRMTQALEAAKRARDRGVNVREARQALKQARAAFEAGNYAAAMERANYILEMFRTPPASALPVAGPTPTQPTVGVADAGSARRWLVQATGSVREAKERGLNVHVAKAALAQAKKALRAGDYRGAIDFSNQALQLCAAATPARR